MTRNFVSPHCHVDSLDSASTPEAFAKREVELGTGALCITDHGTLQATRRVYDLCHGKKYRGKLTPILGIEAYFRDDSCPIFAAENIPQTHRWIDAKTGKSYSQTQLDRLQQEEPELAARCVRGPGSYVDYFKYGHVTLHFCDEAAFRVGSQLLSRADSVAEKHGSERKPIFGWRDLEELGAQNVTMGSGCLIGMVQRHIFNNGRFDLAEKYYQRMRSLVRPGNFFVEVFPHVCDRDWKAEVCLKFEDGTEEKFRTTKLLRTDKKPSGKKNKEGFYANDLAEAWRRSPEGHGCLRAVMEDRKWVERPDGKKIVSVESREGYVVNECQPWAPGGDVQFGCNRAVMELAQKYGDPIIVSDDCLVEGTLIRTVGGYVPVQFVVPGTKIISHTGQIETVEATRGLFTTKPIVKISGRGWSVSMTEDHRVWVRPGSKWASGPYKQNFNEPEWVKAGEIQPGSWAFCPKPPRMLGQLPDRIDLANYFHHRNIKTVEIKEKTIRSKSNVKGTWREYDRWIEWDEDLALIVGLFLGDGNAHNNLTSFALDKWTWERQGPILEKFCLRYGFHSDKTQHQNHYQFRIICSTVAQWFRRNYYQNKVKVPGPVVDLPVNLKWKVVEGLLWSDGTNRNGTDGDGKVNLSMTSLPVISWTREHCLSEGVWSSFSSRIPPSGVLDLYTISFDHYLFDHVQIWKKGTAPKLVHLVYTPDGYWFRIKSVDRVLEQTPVYDLQVSGDSSFSTAYCAVHNCHFANPEDKLVQDIRIGQNGSWRFANAHYRFSSDDAWRYFRDVQKIDEKTFESWVDNSYAWADKFKGFKFSERRALPTKFYPEDTLRHTIQLIKSHGRLLPSRQHEDRLRAEINLLHYNGTIDLLPYFFVFEEVDRTYTQHGIPTGPGRGSAAGLLLSYLLGITHVDPLRYGLSMDRFMTLDRIQTGKLPDIDQDLSSRELLVGPKGDGDGGWLRQRFGSCYAQISVDTTLKLRSAVKDVARWKRADAVHGVGGFVPPEIEVLTRKFLDAPQGITDSDFVLGYKREGEDIWVKGSQDYDPALQEYIQKFPEEWQQVQKCLGITRTKGRHACGYVVADEPIANFIPLTSVGGVTVTQYTAPSVEAAGGLKMDFLVVNSIADIGAAIRLIQDRHGSKDFDWAGARTFKGAQTPILSMKIGGRSVPLINSVPFRGEYFEIWDLPEDQEVFHDICEGKTETVFQFNTPGARKWLKYFDAIRCVDTHGQAHKGLDSIETLAAFTALDRPGPLDYCPPGASHNMLVEYANRAKGREAVGGFPILDRLFPETFGVIVYQEQLQKTFQELGRTTAIEANNFRVHISKKQMKLVQADKAIFMKGAIETIGEEAASQLWESIEVFGQYGFNKSHAICYVIISYACAWLKHHYPLEWWTAVLSNADKKEIDEVFWPHCGHLILSPDINRSGTGFQIEGDRIRAPLSLLQGIGPSAHEELVAARPYKDIEDFCRKVLAKKQAPGKDADGKEKKGRSALHSGIVYKLICSGIMSSLFPEDLAAPDQLSLYEEVFARVNGKKKPKPVDSRYSELKPLQRYQLKKGILTAYGEDLRQLFLEVKTPGISISRAGKFDYSFTARNGWQELIPLAVAADSEALQQLQPLPDGGVRWALAAYVLADERVTYHGSKKMAKLLLDVEGRRQEFIKWPNKEGELPQKLKQSLGGALVLAIVSRYSETREPVIDDVVVVQAPLSFKESDDG